MDQHDEGRPQPVRPEDHVPEHDETQRIDATQRFDEVRQPPAEDGAYAAPVQDGAYAAPQPAAEWPAGQAEPQRPRGPHAPTVLLGLVCLLVAGLAIARQVGGFSLDWSGYGPAVIVGAGVVLLAIGALGLVRDKR